MDTSGFELRRNIFFQSSLLPWRLACQESGQFCKMPSAQLFRQVSLRDSEKLLKLIHIFFKLGGHISMYTDEI